MYTASLVLPRVGDWTIAVNSGFGNSKVTLDPIKAIAAGSAATPLPMHERGHRLFVAKGCVTCHVHGAVEGSGAVATGPNLTPKRYQAEYLAKFLANPSIARTKGVDAIMPDLALKPAEIAALVAFINGDGKVATGR
jgi:mono/diheme cytochrome c family protein